MRRKIVSIALVGFIVSTVTLTTMADQISDAKQKQSTVKSQIDSVKWKKEQEKQNLNYANSQREKLINDLSENKEKYEELIEQLENLDEQIDNVVKSIEDAEENYEQQKERFKKRLRVMYQNSHTTYLEAILSAKNLSEFLNRIKYLSFVAKKDKQLIEEMSISRKDIEYKKELVESERLQVEEQAQQTKNNIDNLSATKSDIDTKISRSYSRISDLERQEDLLIQQAKEIENLIKNLQSNSGQYAGGNMTWPTPGYTGVSSYYGNRVHPIYKTWKFHHGIDINVPHNKSIVAANSGTVIFAGWQSGYGYTVIIDHGGGMSTLYAHTSRIVTKLGNKVKKGEVIAKVGSTGLSTGPHLHFEVRKNGATQDPLKYVKG